MIRRETAEHHGRLASLADTGLAHLFQNWRGLSGRRYICSVYEVKDAPVFDPAQAVVFAVRSAQGGAEILFASAGIADEVEFSRRRAQAERVGATHWHVHLLASTPAEREAAIADVFPRRRLV